MTGGSDKVEKCVDTIGCEDEIVVNGRKVRGRQYPWGVVEVDNSEHCDFAKLRFALLR